MKSQALAQAHLLRGRSSHEERGLKLLWLIACRINVSRRSSHEERGLKFFRNGEIVDYFSRSSHEERGLKFAARRDCRDVTSRSSHEERGLKSCASVAHDAIFPSLLA